MASPTEQARKNAEKNAENVAKENADYIRLSQEYENLPNIPGMRRAFELEHPRWWKKYQGNKNAGGGSAGGGAGTGGGGEGEPTEEPSEEETADVPPAPEGYVYDPATNTYVKDPSNVPATPFNNELMAQVESLLGQYGLNTPGLLDFVRRAVSEGWSFNQIKLEIRRHSDYLANPIFAANIERANNGGVFMAEESLLNYASEAKRLAKQHGYVEPPDSYVAEGLKSNLSLGEIEHRFRVLERVNQYGAGVRAVAEEHLGTSLSDEDLYEIFDPEIDTKEFDDAIRRAEYRGRPFTLGLGIRTEAEARALEMMGVSPDEAFARYKGVADNASRFERLRAIEDLVAQGLPDDFGSHLVSAENGLLIRALLFQDPNAVAKVQDMTAREVARFRQSSRVVGQSGQLTGLLSNEQVQSFG